MPAGSFRKSRVLQFTRPLLGDGLLTAEGGTHKRHRRARTRVRPKRLAAYGEVMVDGQQSALRWKSGERIDLADG